MDQQLLFRESCQNLDRNASATDTIFEGERQPEYNELYQISH